MKTIFLRLKVWDVFAILEDFQEIFINSGILQCLFVWTLQTKMKKWFKVDEQIYAEKFPLVVNNLDLLIILEILRKKFI